jgi:hypothetical protein
MVNTILCKKNRAIEEFNKIHTSKDTHDRAIVFP